MQKGVDSTDTYIYTYVSANHDTAGGLKRLLYRVNRALCS